MEHKKLDSILYESLDPGELHFNDPDQRLIDYLQVKILSITVGKSIVNSAATLIIDFNICAKRFSNHYYSF